MTLFEQTQSSVDDFACTLAGLVAMAKDGRAASLDQCAWAEVSPCGCMSGLTMAVVGDKVLMSAEAAQLQMSGNKTDMKIDVSTGHRMVLVMMEDYRSKEPGGLFEVFCRPCPHDPKWGYARKTRDCAGITFSRMSKDEWRAEDGTEIERITSSGWYLRYPSDPGGDYVQPKYLDRTLDAAFTRAATFLAPVASTEGETP